MGKNKIFDSTFKREIFIGIFILLFTVLIQVGGWLISRNYAKTDNLISKQIELTDRLNRDLQDFYYLSQFSLNQVILKFHKISELNSGLDSPGTLYLNQKQRLAIDDSLRINYPTIYSKSLDADLKATQLNSTLTQIELHFKNNDILTYADSIKNIVSPHLVFNVYINKRLEKDKSWISDMELEEFMANYHKGIETKMNAILNLMVKEYKK